MIDTSQFALPKPGHAAGRVVLSRSAYTRHKRAVWESQGQACSRCSRPLASPADGHLHHPGKRGMGGGKRDDRFGVLLCVDCHQAEEGQLQLTEAS